MIEVKGLYKSFEGKTVLHNIDGNDFPKRGFVRLHVRFG